MIKALKEQEKDLNKNNVERIKMVEKSGTKMGQILTKKNPFKKVKMQKVPWQNAQETIGASNLTSAVTQLTSAIFSGHVHFATPI